ncbi:MAG: response regulator [Patescibacteria group bacterium]
MPKTILIIEDEEYLADMYKIKFEQEGYQVTIARNGPDGIKLTKSVRPDLVFLDLVLPGMDGYEVLEKLKQDKSTKDIKVYILSNLGQKEEIDRGLAAGAEGYFIKANLTPSQLVANIEKIFSGKAAGIKKKNQKNGDKKVVAANTKINGKSVLLIEDQKAIVEMYKLRLEKDGYRVEVARNGAWGIKLAKNNKFDIIVMDMVMPAMNGYDAIEILRADNQTKNVPIIILSNSAQDKDIAKAKKLGATSYLLKSKITPSKLVKEIKKIIK